MKRPLKFPHKVGTYRLGHVNVDLIATCNAGGGSFSCVPDEKSHPAIRVDVDYRHWDECVATLFHEAFEMDLCCRDLRFKRSGTLNEDSADYLFVFDHSQFGQVCSGVAIFIADAFPDLADVYNRYHAKQKKKS